MKKLISIIAILLAFVALSAINFPKLNSQVVDDANIFSSNQERELESKLRGLLRSSDIEAVVVSVKSLEGYSVEDYTIRLAEEWKVGRRDKDNGLILLIAPNERKVRIEVGYGLEANLTAGQAGYVIRSSILPELRKGDYFQGTVAGLTQINNVITGEETITKADIKNSRKKKSRGSVIGYLIFLIIISSLFRGRLFPLLFLGSFMGGNHRGGGGGFGGDGGFSGGGGGFGGGGASGSW